MPPETPSRLRKSLTNCLSFQADRRRRAAATWLHRIINPIQTSVAVCRTSDTACAISQAECSRYGKPDNKRRRPESGRTPESATASPRPRKPLRRWRQLAPTGGNPLASPLGVDLFKGTVDIQSSGLSRSLSPKLSVISNCVKEIGPGGSLCISGSVFFLNGHMACEVVQCVLFRSWALPTRRAGAFPKLAWPTLQGFIKPKARSPVPAAAWQWLCRRAGRARRTSPAMRGISCRWRAR